MSSIDALNEITNMQTQNNIYQQSQEKATGAAQEYDSDMFLQLMMEQMKYQDPLEPMDNSAYLAQLAQLTSTETLGNISDNISANNSMMQTLALVGKEVTITDPDNSSKTITGIVDEASFTGDEATISIGGKTYPTSLLQSVRDVSTTEATDNTASADTTDNTITE